MKQSEYSKKVVGQMKRGFFNEVHINGKHFTTLQSCATDKAADLITLMFGLLGSYLSEKIRKPITIEFIQTSKIGARSSKKKSEKSDDLF